MFSVYRGIVKLSGDRLDLIYAIERALDIQVEGEIIRIEYFWAFRTRNRDVELFLYVNVLVWIHEISFNIDTKLF